MTILNTCVKFTKLLIQLWTNSLRVESVAPINFCLSNIADSRSTAETASDKCNPLSTLTSIFVTVMSHNPNDRWDNCNERTTEQQAWIRHMPCGISSSIWKTTGYAVEKELNKLYLEPISNLNIASHKSFNR